MREPRGYAKKLLPGSGIKESEKPIQPGIIFTQFISYNFDYHYCLTQNSQTFSTEPKALEYLTV